MAEILQGGKFYGVRRRTIKCAFCRGTGVQPRSLKGRCLPCHGKGEVEFGGHAITCPSCKGKGRSTGALGLACVRCKGVGVVKKGEAVDALVERLGEVAKRFSWVRKETEKKTKEREMFKQKYPNRNLRGTVIEKRLKPLKPFVKGIKKETAWIEKLVNNLKKAWESLWQD